MPSPLALYAEAYRNQKAGKIHEAVSQYRRLVTEFPASCEADYATVQLSAVNLNRAQAPAAPVTSRPRPASGVLPVLAFVFACLALAGLAALLLLDFSQRREIRFQQALIKAVSARQSGDRRAFQQYIQTAKAIDSQAKAPYLMAADFFMAQNDLVAAVKALRICPVFDAEVKMYYDKIKRMKKDLGE